MRRLWNWIKRIFREPSRKVPSGTGAFKPNESRQERLVRLYESMKLKTMVKQNESTVQWYKKKALQGRLRYQEVALEFDMPWQVVAVVHALEASFDFSKNLMNGQPYDQKTTWVPKNYGPWVDWHSAAIDAFKLKKQQGKLPAEWTLGSTLEFLLLFNGLGYERKGLVSAYLWSFTNHYVAQGGSKYVADGKFDRSAVSMQVGAALLLNVLDFKKQ